MAPFFVVQEIPDEYIPIYMKDYKVNTGRFTVKGTKKLLGVTKAKNVLLYTPLIKWYLKKRLRITAVHQVIEYKPGTPFAWFPDEVANIRREADQDKSKQNLGNTAKLKGNSFYGQMIEDKTRHTNTKFTCNDNDVDKALRSPYFADLNDINGAYEIQERKREVRVDRPYQCGIAVYQLAKLRMLEFHYDFLDKYFDKSDYELCYMDTDSEYIAFSTIDIDSLVKPELKNEYIREKNNWLAWDKNSERTQGIFKPEFIGTRGLFENSKCYFVENTNNKEFKVSCKGVSKKQNAMTFERYKECLQNFQDVKNGEVKIDIDTAKNTGLRVYEHGMVTYEQKKLGLSSYYDKRFVLPDGIHTRPLW